MISSSMHPKQVTFEYFFCIQKPFIVSENSKLLFRFCENKRFYWKSKIKCKWIQSKTKLKWLINSWRRMSCYEITQLFSAVLDKLRSGSRIFVSTFWRIYGAISASPTKFSSAISSPIFRCIVQPIVSQNIRNSKRKPKLIKNNFDLKDWMRCAHAYQSVAFWRFSDIFVSKETQSILLYLCAKTKKVNLTYFLLCF